MNVEKELDNICFSDLTRKEVYIIFLNKRKRFGYLIDELDKGLMVKRFWEVGRIFKEVLELRCKDEI